eukprot:gene16302-16481_t
MSNDPRFPSPGDAQALEPPVTDRAPDAFDDDEAAPEGALAPLRITTPDDAGGQRLDRVLAEAAPDILSRARIQALMAEGAVTLDGVAMTQGSAKARAGATYEILVPQARAAEPMAQALPLTVLFEDAHLIVDTSGVMVAAKTDVAHIGLSRLFAAHDIERAYVALTRGAPNPASGVIATRLGRSPSDRKKMTVLKVGGREAITHYRVERTYGDGAAAKVSCTLETGRTHQIRVHLASKGAPCLADPVYGAAQPTAPVRAAIARSGLARQALHAAVLGFRHPVTGEALRFSSEFPPDLAALEVELMSL